jgi:hypothetical protein
MTDRRCESVDAVRELYADHQEHRLYCYWCAESIETASVDEAVSWFETHRCDEMIEDHPSIAGV